jgi:transcriptional regulator with XRE-family HTH domain
MSKNFKELEARMSSGAQNRAQEKAEQLVGDMALDELREALKLTQESLADTLHVKQAAISKVERRSDMLISTLRKIIRAMGGELEIRVVFPSGAVRIDQFSDARIRREERAVARASAG